MDRVFNFQFRPGKGVPLEQLSCLRPNKSIRDTSSLSFYAGPPRGLFDDIVSGNFVLFIEVPFFCPQIFREFFAILFQHRVCNFIFLPNQTVSPKSLIFHAQLIIVLGLKHRIRPNPQFQHLLTGGIRGLFMHVR